MWLKQVVSGCIATTLWMAAQAQRPSAHDIFSQMFATTRSIKTVSYEARWTYIDGDNNGKATYADFTTWAKKASSDPLFGYLLHIQLANKNEAADYYYDGAKAIEFHHKHADSTQSKTILLLEPFILPNGIHSLKTRKAAQGFLAAVTATELTPEWKAYLDSMKVFDNGRNWILQWEQHDAEQDHTVLHRLAFDKKNYLISEIHRRTLWKGLSYKADFVLKNIRLNEDVEKDIALPHQYLDYRIEKPGVAEYQSAKIYQ